MFQILWHKCELMMHEIAVELRNLILDLQQLSVVSPLMLTAQFWCSKDTGYFLNRYEIMIINYTLTKLHERMISSVDFEHVLFQNLS